MSNQILTLTPIQHIAEGISQDEIRKTARDLPPEVLLHIFESGWQLVDWMYEPESEDYLYTELNSFLNTVRAVCRQWRLVCSPRERFQVTVAKLVYEDHLADFFIEDFAEYRNALLRSGSGKLLVSLKFGCCNREETDLTILNLQVHAIRLAFEQANKLEWIGLTTRYYFKVIQCFLDHIIDSTGRRSFNWALECESLKDKNHFSDECGALLASGFLAGSWIAGVTDCHNEKLVTHITRAELRDRTFRCNDFAALRGQWASLNALHLVTGLGDIIADQTCEIPHRRICLPLVKLLRLVGMSINSCAQVFSLLDLPRLWKVSAYHTTDIYPLGLVALPASVEEITCGIQTHGWDANFSERLMRLKNSFDFQPLGPPLLQQLEPKGGQQGMSCIMKVANENKRQNNSRKYEVSIDVDIEKYEKAFEIFRITFGGGHV